MPTHTPMTDADFVSLINQEKAELTTEGLGILEQQRSQSNLAYSGEYSAGISESSMSSLIIDPCKPAVDTHTAFLANPFSRRDAIMMSPNAPMFQPVADQVNKLLNHAMHRMDHEGMSGILLIEEWVRSAALNKNGIWKISWDDTMKDNIKELKDMSPEAVDAYVYYLEQQGFEVEILDEQIEMTEQEIIVSDDSLIAEVEPPTDYTGSMYTIKCSRPKNQVKYEIIAPEEFMINEDAEAIGGKHCRYVAHRYMISISDIMKMFPEYDEQELYELTAGGPSDDLEYNYERLIRGQSDGTMDTVPGRSNVTGPNREVELTESWILADRNGDGLTEWVHAYTVGNALLYDEEWTHPIPLVEFTIFNLAHKFWGYSIFDRIFQYLRAKTGLGRGLLDNLTWVNTPRAFGNEDMVNERDFQVIKPGLIKTRKGFSAADISPVPVNQASPMTLPFYQELNKEIAAQLIVDPYTGAISSEAEKSGNDADKTGMIIDNASAKAELVIRRLAEQIKKVSWITLQMYIQHSDEVEVKMLIEELTPGIPFLAAQDKLTDYVKKDDFICNVGLGNLNDQQKFQRIGALMQLTGTAAQFGVKPNPEKVLNLLHAAGKSAGFENTDEFFETMQEYQQKQQQGAQIQQMQMQAAQEELRKKSAEANKIEAEIQKLLSEAEENKADIQLDMRKQQLEEWKAEVDAALTAEGMQNPNQVHTNFKVGG